ncbi:hypothetical protein BDV26DRAFT_279207 [Aspergillus bertholletiae]|uniref:Uncharacterized protein n=1 Tax=Aspergillus bertholletiae TaxID=1226010 RepID=A0A5N7BGN1_9EURO|nr:hypothetical protein BDV26DRAFT_279207 [Aspergillus bertholletiae]
MVCGANRAETHLKFDTLAHQIFSRRPLCRYDSAVLDRTLQNSFNSDCQLYDTTKPLVSSIRVTLIASQIKDRSLCLFSNDRAAGRLQISSAYRARVPKQKLFL